MFVVGGTYRNRLGHYVVLDIKGGKLFVRYENGATATLDIATQTRIINNMPGGQGAQQGLAPRVQSTRTTVVPMHSINWTRYDLWNSAIFRRFFGGDAPGRLAYIDIDEEELTQMAPDGEAVKAPSEDFIHTLAETLDLKGVRLLDEHFGRLGLWKSQGSPAPPPFLALLALFCLAAQSMRSDQQFKASNYFDRFVQILLGARYSDAQRRALASGFRRAQLLWQELDGWLWDRSGRYGLPSAQPMYRLSHVGWPISQALLRSHDRQRLPEFFGEAGLESGQHVSPADMERILAPWFPTSPLSQAAKASWNDSAARRRMAEVVSLELSVWDGSSPGSQQVSPYILAKPIALEVTFQSGPRPRMVWGLVFPMPTGATVAIFDVEGDGRGLKVGERDVRIISAVRGLDDRWSEPISDVSIPDLLVTRVEMVAREEPLKCAWQPRKVLVLTWDDEIKVYRSEHRLEFGRRGTVLAYKTVAADVERVLAQVSDGGMRRVPDSWGVPEDWVAFKDVRLTGIPDTGDDDDLAALVPAIWSSVEWNGGISLPGRKQWLSSRLPVVSINSIEDVQRLSVGIHRKSALAHAEELGDPTQLTYAGNTADVDLATVNLTDGVYGLTVTAYRGDQDKAGEDLARRTFEVRSSDSPLSRGAERLSHRSDTRQWQLSASPAADEPNPPTVSIEGALVWPGGSSPSTTVELPSDIGRTEGADHEDLLGAGQGVQRTIKDMTECFRGAHYFVLPTVLTMSHYHRQTTSGVCRRCGLRKAFPRPRSRRAWPMGNTQQQVERKGSTKSGTAVPIASVPDSQTPDYDGLLEACGTLGGGPLAHFELLARQSSNMPAFPHEAIQLFSALGHIDLEWNLAGTHVVQWKVAPPVLATTASGHVYLAGYRSLQLLEAIREATQEHGGTYAAVPNGYGPTSHRITALGKDSLGAVVDSVNQSATVHLHIADRSDLSIAAALPPLRSVLTADREVPEPKAAARFDVDRTSWVPNAFPDSDGLYRTDSMPRSYSLRSGRIWYGVSYRTGKHLAGASVGRSLLAYHDQNQQLVCPLGAQLPGLYERAAVLSSGLPPVVDLRQSRVIYKEVPREVAASVWTAVYSDGAA